MTRRAEASRAAAGDQLAADYGEPCNYDWVAVADWIRERHGLAKELHVERNPVARQMLEAQIKIIDAKIAKEKAQ